MKSSIRIFTLAILLAVTGITGGEAFAQVSIPNGDFSLSEVFTPTYSNSGEMCVTPGDPITRPVSWASWYDRWCDEGIADYCTPCQYMVTTQEYEPVRESMAMRIGAANRAQWFEGTAEVFIPHDDGQLPSKMTGWYMKPGDPANYFAHYIDPQVIFLRKGADLDNFYFCQQGMLTGCNLNNPDDVILSVIVAPHGEDHLKLGPTNGMWQSWEREIPELTPEEAAEVGTIVVRVRHIASGTSDVAWVDDIAFEYTYDCELDFDGNERVDMEDLIVQAPVYGGFYYATWIWVNYPQYLSYFHPDVDPMSLDWDGNGVVEMRDAYAGTPSGSNLNTYYTQWLLYLNYPSYYPTFYPLSNCPL